MGGWGGERIPMDLFLLLQTVTQPESWRSSALPSETGPPVPGLLGVDEWTDSFGEYNVPSA